MSIYIPKTEELDLPAGHKRSTAGKSSDFEHQCCQTLYDDDYSFTIYIIHNLKCGNEGRVRCYDMAVIK